MLRLLTIVTLLIQATLQQSESRDYDFIVVGAGSSGCVVAARLTENPDWNVLLLEAGGPEEAYQDIPLLAANLEGTAADWQYLSEPSPHSFLGVKNHVGKIPRGKVMGGSSVLNYMAFSIGHNKDYTRWAEEMGCDGWSFDDVLPYFKKFETYNDPENFDPDANGDDGPVVCERAPYYTEISTILLDAFKKSGYRGGSYNTGHNNYRYSRIVATINNGSRWSTNSAYIKPNQGRENLDIEMYARVLKVLIDPETKEAYGVEYEKNGTIYYVNATKEVILSAGAINTPQILMLSGVGPADLLTELNIPVIKHAFVGFNLYDHPSLIPIIVESEALSSPNPFTNQTLLNQYSNERDGPLTIPGGQELIAFNIISQIGIPEVEFFVTTQQNTMRALLSKFDYFPQIEPLIPKLAWMGICVLLKPYSTGRVKLRSNDPYDAPIIDLNFFADERDLHTMGRACRDYYRVFNVSRLNDATPTDDYRLLLEMDSCSRNFVPQSVEYLECLALYYGNTLYHQCGTCKMGAESDPTAVVNPQLQVIGIENLRVIDCSITPDIPSAHMNGPAIMIGEKGADMIKDYYNFND